MACTYLRFLALLFIVGLTQCAPVGTLERRGSSLTPSTSKAPSGGIAKGITVPPVSSNSKSRPAASSPLTVGSVSSSLHSPTSPNTQVNGKANPPSLTSSSLGPSTEGKTTSTGTVAKGPTSGNTAGANGSSIACSVHVARGGLASKLCGGGDASDEGADDGTEMQSFVTLDGVRAQLGNPLGEEGNTAEVFELPNGFGRYPNVVAKRYYVRTLNAEVMQEITNLQAVKPESQYVAHGVYDNHAWVIVQRQPGVPLNQLRGYQQATNKATSTYAQCTAYLETVRAAVTQAYIVAAGSQEDPGVLQKDTSIGNVLFEEGPPLTAHLIDWGQADPRPPSMPNSELPNEIFWGPDFKDTACRGLKGAPAAGN